MPDAPEWMDDEEREEWLEAECDECGIQNEGCECGACQECFEFGPIALTKNQNLSLCENCAEEQGVELININDALRRIIE